MSVARSRLMGWGLALMIAGVMLGPYPERMAPAMAAATTTQARTDAAAMAEAIVRTGSVVVPGVTFDTGTATLRAGSERALREIVKVLNEHTDWRFEVQGHTDRAAGADASLRTSDQRARTVVAWLTKNGVDGSRLVAKGYGDSQPLSAGAAGAHNDRIELMKLNEE